MFEKSEEEKYLLHVYAQETTQGDRECDCCRLKLMVERHLEQKIKDSGFKASNRDEDRPAIGSPSKKKENAMKRPKKNFERGNCIRSITKCKCSFGDSCAFKHDPNKKGKRKGRPPSPSPTSSLHRNSKGDGKGSDDGSASGIPKLTGKSPSGEANRQPCTKS